jgi:hypothetical protein
LKKLLSVFGALAALFVVGITAVFYFSSGMVDVSDTFFKDVAAGDMQRARSYLAADFRAATSEDELRSFLGRSALLDYSQSHWSNRQVSIGGTGHLEGDVSTKSGGKIPLTLTFVKENGGWKIYSIQKSQAGLVAESGGQAIPSKTEAAKLAVDTTLSFARAVNANDLKAFYAQTAAEFQHDVPFEKFSAGFSPFIEHHINLAPVEKVAPLLTSEPGVSPQGVLQVEGYFPFTESHVNFSYKYIYRFTDWKIVGINVHVKPVDH